MHDIWSPWHGCTKISEGCAHCYMYFLDKIHGNYYIGDKKYFILIGAIVAAVLLGLIAHIVTTDRTLTPIEKAVKDTVLLVQKVAYQPIKFVKDKVVEYQEKQDLYEKYKTKYDRNWFYSRRK